MLDATFERQLSTFMNQLPIDQQRQVVEFARNLTSQKIKGVAGSTLLSFAGSIDAKDLELMSQAIAEGCGGRG